MEELKLLVEMVANLPTLTVWVLVGYLVYKLAVVGSTFGVIRLVIVKAHDWAVKPRQAKLGAFTISEEVHQRLVQQIIRIQRGSSTFFHSSDLERLREAIDAFESAERRK